MLLFYVLLSLLRSAGFSEPLKRGGYMQINPSPKSLLGLFGSCSEVKHEQE